MDSRATARVIETLLEDALITDELGLGTCDEASFSYSSLRDGQHSQQVITRDLTLHL